MKTKQVVQAAGETKKAWIPAFAGALVTICAILTRDIWAYTWSTELQGAATVVVMGLIAFVVRNRRAKKAQ